MDARGKGVPGGPRVNRPKVQGKGKGHQIGAAGLVQRVTPWRGPWPSGPSASSSLVGTWVVGRLAESRVLCMVSSNTGASLRDCAHMEQHQMTYVKAVPPSMRPIPTQKGCLCHLLPELSPAGPFTQLFPALFWDPPQKALRTSHPVCSVGRQQL